MEQIFFLITWFIIGYVAQNTPENEIKPHVVGAVMLLCITLSAMMADKTANMAFYWVLIISIFGGFRLGILAQRLVAGIKSVM